MSARSPQQICERFGVSKATLYRYGSPGGGVAALEHILARYEDPLALSLGSAYCEDLLQKHPFADGNLQADLFAIRPSSSGTETDSIWRK